MRYSAIYAELMRRLDYHAKPGRMLAGLRIIPAGEWQINSADDKPCASILDFKASEGVGANAEITIIVMGDRRNGFVQEEGAQYKGIVDWVELVMDAVETSPSTGRPDPMLNPHAEDGTPLTAPNGTQYPSLLTSELSMSFEQEGVTDNAITFGVKVSYRPTLTRKATRRGTPTPPIKSPGY